MSRTNLATNPTLGVDLTTWNAGNAATTLTRDTTVFHSGTASCQVTKTSTGATVPSFGPFPVTVGQTYMVSVWANIPAGTFGNFGICNIYWYNGATFLSATTGITVNANVGNGGVWTRYNKSGVAPASSTQAYVVFNNNQSMNAGYSFWLDDLLVENSASLGSYFDGSTAADSSYTYSWTGTPHNSTSLATDVVGTSPKVRVSGVATAASKKVRVSGATTAATRRVRVGGVAT